MPKKEHLISESYTVQDAPSLAPEPAEAPRRKFEDLPPAAQRALKEAETRRKEIDARHNAMDKEVNGRGGLEPTRYEDWEIKGITVDF
ncbi:DUF1674 domain-containing protein [Roseibium sp. RKSG952]|uniref:DUF1674 domain-containing protein n=1 Tax=Roseibium sp. RKSG952 TaxID=2529384 RepID=UPI0012BD74B2|nr:DUF1674 domain-containing protein [Roseibium sp. RKSG952]MTH97165.1 DUF1674 domain-containing protein [Roseibium sp. RKSG952]